MFFFFLMVVNIKILNVVKGYMCAICAPRKKSGYVETIFSQNSVVNVIAPLI